MRPAISALIGFLLVTVCFAATASAAPVSGDGVVHACMLTKGKKATRGLLRVVRKESACRKRKGERPLSWSVAGPAGAPGATGSRGETGSPGASGSVATLEKTVNETIASQAQQIAALSAEVDALTSELLGLESGLGTLAGSLDAVETGLTTLEGSVGSVETGLTTLGATVGETCTGLEAVTDQSNLLRTTLGGVNTALGLVKALVPTLGIPALPAELPEFECK